MTEGDGTVPAANGAVVIIGGGFGGMATAIRLQAAGYAVTLVEARERLGGRAYQLTDSGFTFDMGPSLITAPHLLDELWAAAGRRRADELPLTPLTPYYRIVFQDGQQFDYGGGTAADEAEIARVAPDDVAGFRAFMQATEHIYQRAFADLAGQPFLTLGSLARVTPELLRLGGASSVYQFVSRFIRDERLRTIFSFHPLFIGGNPFRASAIYSIVPYLERQHGVHYTMGGMYRVVEAMERLFRDLGGAVRCGQAVTAIQVSDGRATGVRLADGTAISAAAVVANSDVTTTYLRLVPPAYRRRTTAWRLRRHRYSMSCFLLYLGLNRQYEHLRHHTVIMPRHYRRLVTQVFDGRGLPDDLALYLHTPTRTDPSMAPPGGESLTVLAPVPHLGRGVDWRAAARPFRDRVIAFLEQNYGLTGLSNSIVVEHQFTPLDFEASLGSWLGAAFSIEPTLIQSAWFRPHNQSGDLPGLYFVGAGTHPGAGIPGVLLSAAITSRLVRDQHPLHEAPARHASDRSRPHASRRPA
jgi:phytoene desaturase